jgi:hypothetical protein
LAALSLRVSIITGFYHGSYGKALTQLDRGEQNPLLIFPVAYGDDADISALNTIARTSSTKVITGDESGIQQLFELLSSYF